MQNFLSHFNPWKRPHCMPELKNNTIGILCKLIFFSQKRHRRKVGMYPNCATNAQTCARIMYDINSYSVRKNMRFYLIILRACYNIYIMPWPKVPLSLPAQNRECTIFGPGMVKNSIRSTGVKLSSPYSCLTPSPSARVAIQAGYGLSKFFPPQVRSNILLCKNQKIIFSNVFKSIHEIPCHKFVVVRQYSSNVLICKLYYIN